VRLSDFLAPKFGVVHATAVTLEMVKTLTRLRALADSYLTAHKASSAALSCGSLALPSA
jgi:hypothetical protein